jgi:3-oxoacyl-[acyl-carrier-protein] synthase-3
MLFRNVAIESIDYDLAPHRVTSAWLEDQIAGTLQRLNIPRGSLEKLSGIRERRFWDQGTRPSDVATRAAAHAIDRAAIDPRAIGCLINTSVCRDYLEPSTASLVHGNLELAPHCVNYDIGNACLGFLNGMVTAGMMIEAGLIDYGLVVDGEGSQELVMATIERLRSPETTIQDFRDNFAALTLGSGAVAMVLTHRERSRTGHLVNGVVTLAATEHRQLCVGQPTWMKTDAATLLKAGVRLAAATWGLASETLPDWRDERIQLYAIHQVSARHTAACADALKVPLAKFVLNYAQIGNVGPAALPISLAQAVEQGRVRSGDHVGLLGIGSGLNCSMMSVTW